MKKVTRVIAAVLMIAGLGAGCGNGNKSVPEPETADHPEVAGATNWAPETAEEPHAHDPNDGHDHTGHNH